MPFENMTSENLAKANAAILEARADQGYGFLGPWPGESAVPGPKSGEYLCEVRIKAKGDDTTVFKWKTPIGEEIKRPGYRVSFDYVAIADYDSGSTPVPRPEHFAFNGVSLNIPYDISNLPSKGSDDGNIDWRARSALDALKGHLKGLLGYDVTDVPAAVSAVEKMQADAEAKQSSIKARVFLRIEKREYTVNRGPDKGQRKTALNKSDHIRELISS